MYTVLCLFGVNILPAQLFWGLTMNMKMINDDDHAIYRYRFQIICYIVLVRRQVSLRT